MRSIRTTNNRRRTQQRRLACPLYQIIWSGVRGEGKTFHIPTPLTGRFIHMAIDRPWSNADQTLGDYLAETKKIIDGYKDGPIIIFDDGLDTALDELEANDG